ncbi:MAG: BON domain-containing protein [Trichloromonadaceae bacterium]
MKLKNFLSLMVASVAMLAISIPVLASDKDDAIESSIERSHVFRTYLKDDDIKIKSKDGVVTLKGTVSGESHKALAAETVSGIPGVKSVDNKLEFKGEQPDEMSDGWLMTKVKTTLLYHRSVSGLQTEVNVKDGVVTLLGEADSRAQKDLTTEYAKDIEGVKDVINKMTVATITKEARKDADKKDEKAALKEARKDDKKDAMSKDDHEARTAGDKIDDASITALVKMSLLSHRSTSGLKTKVETKDGVVTLSGQAKNPAEKDLATKFAKDVNGVTEVNNRMTID